MQDLLDVNVEQNMQRKINRPQQGVQVLLARL